MPRKKTEQPELNNMPAPDKVGVCATNFRTCLERVQEATEAKGEAMMALIKSMRSAKRTSIQVDGYRFEVNHTGPKDSIKVTKPK